MRSAAIIVALLLGTGVACNGSADTPTATVVGVILKCQTYTGSGDVISLTEDACRDLADERTLLDYRLEVRVKPSDGDAYTTELPPTTRVRIGDPWPPPD